MAYMTYRPLSFLTAYDLACGKVQRRVTKRGAVRLFYQRGQYRVISPLGYLQSPSLTMARDFFVSLVSKGNQP